MNIGYKLFEGTENFDELQLEMALTCDENGWCMEEEKDKNNKRYLVINAPKKELEEEKLVRFKLKKKEELKAARDNAETEPIEYNGNIYDYDEKARERMRIARQAMEDGLTNVITWTLADNTTTDVTVKTFIGINTKASTRAMDVHAKYNALKCEVAEAKTVAEVEAIKWE